MAAHNRDVVLDAIADLALISFMIWTVSVPLQWGSVPFDALIAQGVAWFWVVLAAYVRKVPPK